MTEFMHKFGVEPVLKQDEPPTEPPARGIDHENSEQSTAPDDEVVSILNDDSKAEDVASWLQDYWGNFHSFLPGGGYRRLDRDSEIELTKDKTGKTYGEACDDLDASIEELGLDLEKIERLQREIKELLLRPVNSVEEDREKSEQRTAKRNELYRYIAPLYLSMRKKGYSKGELYR